MSPASTHYGAWIFTAMDGAPKRAALVSGRALMALGLVACTAAFLVISHDMSADASSAVVHAAGRLEGNPDGDASNAPRASSDAGAPDTGQPDHDGDMAYYGTDEEMMEFLEASAVGDDVPEVVNSDEILESLGYIPPEVLEQQAREEAAQETAEMEFEQPLEHLWAVSGNLTVSVAPSQVTDTMLESLQAALSQQATLVGCDVADVTAELAPGQVDVVEVPPTDVVMSGGSAATSHRRRLTRVVAAALAQVDPATESIVQFVVEVRGEDEAAQLTDFVEGPTFESAVVAELSKDPEWVAAEEETLRITDVTTGRAKEEPLQSWPEVVKDRLITFLEITPWNIVALSLWELWGATHILLGIVTFYFASRNQPDEVLAMLARKANPKQFEIHWAPAAHRLAVQHGFNLLWIGAWACAFAALRVRTSDTSGYMLMCAPLIFQLGTWVAFDIPNYGSRVLKFSTYTCNLAMLAQVYDLHDQGGWGADEWFFCSLPSWIFLAIAILYLCIQPKAESSTAAYATKWSLTHPDLAGDEDIKRTTSLPFGAPKGAHVHKVGF